MALWCRSLPLVYPPPSATPTRLTLIVPYYENPRFFARQCAGWAELPEDVAPHVSIIVVDDGSPQHPAANVERRHVPGMRQFRIDIDVRWNWLAARNVGAHHADDGWMLLTDMDHVVPVETFRAVIYKSYAPRTMYAFSRVEHTGQFANPHSASFLMTRSMFWKIGGYDEALSGFYGTDGEYRRRAASVAKMALLRDVLVRHEYVEDSSTTRYQRKQPMDAKARAMIAARGKNWRPKALSFPYREVTA